MYQNNADLKEQLSGAIARKGAVIASIGDYFTQYASTCDNSVYAEAVSHNFNDSLSPALEESFAAIGYSLSPGGNYYKMYHESEIDKIISDTENIFVNLYRADYLRPLEFTDAE